MSQTLFLIFKSSKDRTKLLDGNESEFYDNFSNINDLKIQPLARSLHSTLNYGMHLYHIFVSLIIMIDFDVIRKGHQNSLFFSVTFDLFEMIPLLMVMKIQHMWHVQGKGNICHLDLKFSW